MYITPCQVQWFSKVNIFFRKYEYDVRVTSTSGGRYKTVGHSLFDSLTDGLECAVSMHYILDERQTHSLPKHLPLATLISRASRTCINGLLNANDRAWQTSFTTLL
jgi:hypothetical protein